MSTNNMMVLIVGCAGAGMLICTPAHAAGGEMPSLFGFVVIFVLAAVGVALHAVPAKPLGMLLIAVSVAGLVVAISSYGATGFADRSAQFALLMSCLTLPLLAGWLFGHVVRKRLSGTGMRHG